MGHVARAAVTALCTYAAVSVATVLVAAQFDGWERPGNVPPLRPTPLPLVATDSPALERVEQVEQVEQVATEVDAGDTRLRRWIVRPTGHSGPTPGLVLVPGAGSSNRDTMLGQARALASRNITVVTYDKRLDGYSWFSRDYHRLANDAVAAARVLRTDPSVDSARIGVLGWSEGGWVAPLAVAAEPELFAYLILVSASIVSPLEQASWIVDRSVASLADPLRRVPASVLASGRVVVDYLDFDVRPVLAELRVPVYAVWGGDDGTVPVTAAARRLLTATGAPTTIHVVGNAGHDPGEGWMDGAANWIEHPADTDRILGEEPRDSSGVAHPPRGSWFTNPALQSLFAAATAALTVILFARRRTMRPEIRRNERPEIRSIP